MSYQSKTVGLSLIVKDEVEQVLALVTTLEPYFDKVFITVTGKDSYRDFVKAFEGHDKVQFSQFKWVDDFAKARNYNLEQIDTDYFFWVDADDEVINHELIPEMFKWAVENQVDAVRLNYNYAQDQNDHPVGDHVRERLVNRHHDYKWKGAVHETLIPKTSPREDDQTWINEIEVKHSKTDEGAMESAKRNLKILEREYKKDKDPRYAHYLGLTHYNLGNFEDAIGYLLEHIRTAGSEDDIYNSWIYIARCNLSLENPDKAIAASLAATKVMPNRQTAYFLLGQIYADDYDDGEKALEWLTVGFGKPMPKTWQITDPTERLRARLLAGIVYLNLGKVEEAYKVFKTVIKLDPENPVAKNYMPIVDEAYYEKQAIDRVKWLFSYFKDRYGNEKTQKFFTSLPGTVFSDVRLNPERNQLYPPKTWGGKSIVIFCGESLESWGPDTLDKGMGGSEEAIVYLSRELAAKGYEVTVYNDREEEYIDGNYNEDGSPHGFTVTYKPWTLFSPKDQFNVLVLWRNPLNAAKLKARFKIVDVHDVTDPEWMEKVEKEVDKFFVKSRYHRSLTPSIADNKFSIIGNGIKTSQFKPTTEDRGHTVGYFSSYNRGLECLLDMWPEIRKQVPDATLDIYYGWQSYDIALQGDPKAGQWKYRMLRKFTDLADQGVTEHGRISHEELADVMCKTKVWAYPTEFPEIHCITALKAQEAGCMPVVTNFAALQETVVAGCKVEADDIYTNKEKQDEFVRAVVTFLKSGKGITTKPDDMDWSDVADKWIKEIEKGLK